MRPTRPRPQRQRGVAVVTALLLTTLAISIVASLFWQQQVEVRSMENQRLHLQTRWILRGAVDWATLVLFQDAMDHPRYTSLDQVWATPLAETRLDQYIERERIEGENFNATLSGNITDACSRYNLRNLAQDYKNIDGDQLDVFKRLLSNVQLDPSLAQRVASVVAFSLPAQALPSNVTNNGGGNSGNTSSTNTNGANTNTGNDSGGGVNNGIASMGTASNGSGGANSNLVLPTGVTGVPMRLLQVDDLLAVPGFTPAMVERLRPFVIVLPEVTPVNVNTAPAEVLAAVANVSMSAANTMIVRRKQAPWADKPTFDTEVGSQTAGMAPNSADVKSQWFLVDSRIRLDRAALDAEALVHRPLNMMASGGPSVAWVRQY